MNIMKKWLSVLAMLLIAVLALTACGAKEDKSEATKEPAPTEAPKSEEELILERDTAAIKLAVEVTKTMKASAGEKAAAEEEGSKIARYYKRISDTSIDNPYRAVVLTPTDEQFQTVKTLTGIDAEYKTAPALAKLVNGMFGGKEYGKAAEAVSAEADASAIGENVIVLLPCEDIVIVSIHNGKAMGSLFWGSNTDYPPEQITQITGMIGITDLTYRNYDRDTLKTMMGE